MLKLRTGLVLAALLLCGCDHHKNPNQAQTAAGTAAVGRSDSEYTGETPPATNAPTYPRAVPVAETNAAPATGAPIASGAPAAASPASTAPAPDIGTLTLTQPPAVASTASPADNSSTTSAATTSTDTMTEVLPVPAAPTPVPVPDEAQEQVVIIDTSLGRIVIEPDDSAAPKTSENFRKLAADGFYNHTIFHRVIPHFIIQGGDPNSLSEDRSLQGKGGPGYTLPPEIKLKHERGAVAMARLPDSVNPGRESNGSQFYICVVNSPSLDDQYTVFGHVIKGMDVVDAISNEPRDNHDNPINRIEMEVTVESKAQAMSAGSAAGP